jgi:Shikimate dehydrogenase substrate binding domain
LLAELQTELHRLFRDWRFEPGDDRSLHEGQRHGAQFSQSANRVIRDAGGGEPDRRHGGSAYRHHRLDIRYINCEVPPEKLTDAVKGARAMGWIGFNCSIPHKVAVIEHLDGLDDSAMVIGAVNCAVRRGEKFIGENTDGKGFLQSLREVVDPEGKQVVMFRTGGAARAIGV